MAKTINLATKNGHVISLVGNIRKFNVSVDGNHYGDVKLKGSANWLTPYEDYPIIIDDVEYILVMRGRKKRIALNGQYIDNGEEFVPQKPFSAFYWVFFALNVLIPIVSLGGFINVLIALLGAIACHNVYIGKIKSSAVKALVCLMITVVTWIVWVLMSFLIFSIL